MSHYQIPLDEVKSVETLHPKFRVYSFCSFIFFLNIQTHAYYIRIVDCLSYYMLINLPETTFAACFRRHEYRLNPVNCATKYR